MTAWLGLIIEYPLSRITDNSVHHAYFNSPNFAKSFWVREVDMDDELMERGDDSSELLDASADY